MSELQRSRERLIAAREEERLRLRRDLHDGLGPTLAALVFKVGLIRDSVRVDPARSERLLIELGRETKDAIADIRTLVYALRPPALDELGLVGAVREQAALLAETAGLDIVVESPELPELPPAVEVAAYRIVIEALTNASRHANASRCDVDLRLADGLELDISDDGIGLADDCRPGVGLRSMRERAVRTRRALRRGAFSGRRHDDPRESPGRSMSGSLRVLIADDHPLFRQGLRAALDETPGIDVVAEAADGAESVRLAIELAPDVVLMDLQMPELSGVDATRRILEARPETHVLVLTMFDGDSSVFAAIRAGAKGFLLKGADQQDVERAIRTVAAGEAVFGSAIATRLVSYFASNRAPRVPGAHASRARRARAARERPRKPGDRGRARRSA